MGPHAAFLAGLSALVIVWFRLPSPLGWAVMGRAFGPQECWPSALVIVSFRLPSPLGWAGMGRAFGPQECQRMVSESAGIPPTPHGCVADDHDDFGPVVLAAPARRGGAIRS